jgi:ADP-dependent NAD(P)H-hydrate dehydratase
MHPDRNEIDAELLGRWKLPDPSEDGDKDLRGRVVVVGGSRPMPGAVILAATAALRAGAGKLRILTVDSVAVAVGAAVPEAYVEGLKEANDGGFHHRADFRGVGLADAVLLGPGTIDNAELADLVLDVLGRLSADQVAVLDAGALTVLAGRHDDVRKLECKRVITPHRGEMATLLGVDRGSIEADPDGAVRLAATELGAVAVLKGSETLVSDGEGIWANHAGNVGLAVSGSGDVLAGVLAGLCARGTPPLHAAAWAVYLHARAGDRLAGTVGPVGYLPREILAEIPRLMAR